MRSSSALLPPPPLPAAVVPAADFFFFSEEDSEVVALAEDEDEEGALEPEERAEAEPEPGWLRTDDEVDEGAEDFLAVRGGASSSL
jgi:hypothetical protein